jgi:FdhD protein
MTVDDTLALDALCYQQGRVEPIGLELIGEEPLLFRIQGNPYAVVMRTPGDEIFHAAGFCLAEGIADTADDFTGIGYCKDLDSNVIEIRLKPERIDKIQPILARRGFVSQTGCGICGKQMIQDFQQTLAALQSEVAVTPTALLSCINKLVEHQQYYARTKGSHAALLLDQSLEPICFAEDVGRHNALDKAIGNALLNRSLSRAAVLVLSSRISYELIQKAARAQVPVIISNSRPTALAARMGKALNMTLAFPSKDACLTVVCGRQRIVTK